MIVPAPALIVDIPVTVSASLTPVPCVMAPPLDVATKAPATVPVPKFKAPVEVAVSAPVLNVPSVNPFSSVTEALPPPLVARLTAASKSLPILSNVIFPPVARKEETPTELIVAPTSWVILPIAEMVSVLGEDARILPKRIAPFSRIVTLVPIAATALPN